MGKLKLKPKQLSELGFPQNPAISMTMSVMEKHYKYRTFEEVVPILKELIDKPDISHANLQNEDYLLTL
jgi:tRNA-splicing ligase RtcB (3'-phosphate/5'-hydroxy nucleic acid ligase)